MHILSFSKQLVTNHVEGYAALMQEDDHCVQLWP